MSACTIPYRSQSTAAVQQPKITVLYDAFGEIGGLQKDWGYSALVEAGGKRILFDTGDNPDILAANAKALGVNLSRLDFVVMSHRHRDHMGGMEYLLKVNPNVRRLHCGLGQFSDSTSTPKLWLVQAGLTSPMTREIAYAQYTPNRQLRIVEYSA